jgi:hypothetical protein
LICFDKNIINKYINKRDTTKPLAEAVHVVCANIPEDVVKRRVDVYMKKVLLDKNRENVKKLRHITIDRKRSKTRIENSKSIPEIVEIVAK